MAKGLLRPQQIIIDWREGRGGSRPPGDVVEAPSSLLCHLSFLSLRLLCHSEVAQKKCAVFSFVLFLGGEGQRERQNSNLKGQTPLSAQGWMRGSIPRP